jgi:hypothetical protein
MVEESLAHAQNFLKGYAPYVLLRRFSMLASIKILAGSRRVVAGPRLA